MPKCKVLFITSKLIPPQSTLLNNVAKSDGIELHVLLDSEYRDALPGGVELDTSLIKKHVCSGMALPVFSEAGIFYNVDFQLVSYMLKNKFDLFILGGYHLFSSHVAYLISNIYSCPYILYSETHNHGNRLQIKSIRSIKDRVINKITNKAASYVATSTWAKDFLVSRGAKTDDVFVIPYLPEIDHGRFTDQRLQCRTKLGISPDSFTLLWVGRMIPRKRIDTLLYELKKLENRVNSELILVGSGDEAENLKSLQTQLNLTNIKFVGDKNHRELVDYYNAADVFVYPSEYEPFGAVITEALSYGLPVITTDCVASAADFISHGKNGFIISEKHSESMAEVIYNLSSDKDFYSEVKGRVIQTMGKYNNQDNADKFSNAIYHAMKSKC